MKKRIKLDIFEIAKKQDKSDELWEMITNYLTDEYGFCVNSYSIAKSDIVICDIDFDTND